MTYEFILQLEFYQEIARLKPSKSHSITRYNELQKIYGKTSAAKEHSCKEELGLREDLGFIYRESSRPTENKGEKIKAHHLALCNIWYSYCVSVLFLLPDYGS